jgi:hypothetical protein
MTGRMNDQQLDSEIRRFLGWQSEALDGAPTAREVAIRVDLRVGSRAAGARRRPLAWAVLAALLVLALAIAALTVGGPDRPLVRVSSPTPTNRLLAYVTTPSDRPSGPPTNGWIAYSTRQRGAVEGGSGHPVPGEIFVVRDGETPRRIAGSGEVTVCPAFAPDGTKLAFLQGDDLVVLDGDPAQDMHELHRFLSVGHEIPFCPAWSPSSEALAVVVHDGIAVLGLDGTGFTIGPADPIVSRSYSTSMPLAWTPDGTAIGYAAEHGIWLVRADGADPLLLSNARSPWISWSPDGSRLAFHDTLGVAGVAPAENGVLTIDGSAPVRPIGPGTEPIWSPLGNSIALDNLTIASAVDGRRTVQQNGIYDGGYGFGGWSPDGRWLLRMIDVSGFSFTLVAISIDAEPQVVLASGVQTGSSRNFPDLGDVSWQPDYP